MVSWVADPNVITAAQRPLSKSEIMARIAQYQPDRPLPDSRPQKLLFIFLDGVGIGVDDAERNPFSQLKGGLFPLFLGRDETPSNIPGAPLPAVQVSARIMEQAPARAHSAWHGVLDAGLDLPGLPQSATGQATLFTGYNGAQLLGHHLMAFPETKLTRLVQEHNLLLKAEQAGRKAAFLNTYTPRFHELGYPHSVSTLMALSLKRGLMMLDEMRAGLSLFHDITQEGLRAFYGEDIPVFEPYEAGQRLAGAAQHQEISVYEYFWTDRIGHKANFGASLTLLERVEQFLAGVIDHSPQAHTLVVVCTDHGNIEDARTRGHTRNPVALSAWGEGAEWITSVCRGLQDVTPALLRLFDIPALKT